MKLTLAKVAELARQDIRELKVLEASNKGISDTDDLRYDHMCSSDVQDAREFNGATCRISAGQQYRILNLHNVKYPILLLTADRLY